MATQDWSPSMFAGQSWSAWADNVPLTNGNDDDDLPTQNEEETKDDSMKLRKKDVSLFGFCPSQDEFFLVLCEKCNKAIKPQAFKQHMVKRHGVKDSHAKRSGSTSHTYSSSGVHSISPRKDDKFSSGHPTCPVPTKASVKQTPPNIAALARARQNSALTSQTAPSSSCIKDKVETTPTKVKKAQSLPFVKVERMSEQIVTKKTQPVCPESNSKANINNSSIKTETLDPDEKIDILLDSSLEEEKKVLKTSPAPSASPLVLLPSKPIAKLTKTTVSPPTPPLPTVSKSVSAATSQSSPLIVTSSSSVMSPVVSVKSEHSISKPLISSTLLLTPTTSSVFNKLVSSSISSTAAPTCRTSSTASSVAKVPVKEKFLPCKDREYDANKHCGVWIEDIQRSCTRSLTCKTHALSLRRAVKGRVKPFDDLLKEHRIAKEALLKAKALAAGLPPPTSKYSYLLEESEAEAAAVAAAVSGATISHSKPTQSMSPQKLNKTPNKHIGQTFQRLSVSGVYSSQTSVSEEAGSSSSRVGISSDGEPDENSEKDMYLNRHPRPAAMCTFGARMMNGSRYSVFNHKSDFVRAAVISALEKHLQPPPHKKLCIESNLPKDSNIVTNAIDPYEFVDPTGHAASNFSQMFNNSQLRTSSIKPKSKPTLNKPLKPTVGSRSPGSSNSIPNVTNINPSKRKRNLSSHGNNPSPVISQTYTNIIQSLPTNNNTNNTTSPIATIAIPGVNITGTTIGQFNTAGKTNHLQFQKNNLVNKDGQVNFVFTGLDPNLTRNGCVSISTAQLNQVIAADDKNAKKSRTSIAGAKNNNKLVNTIEGIKSFPNVFTIPQNTVYMDSSSLQGALLAQVPNLTSTNNNTIMSLTTPIVSSHQLHDSSHLTNGVNSPADKLVGNRQKFVTGHKSITTQGLPLLHSTGGTLNPTQIFPSQTQLNPIQVKSSNINISKKVAMQPMLTIPLLSQSNLSALGGQQTQHTFLLRTSTDDGQKQEIHLQQPLQSSSTNLIS